MRQAVKFLATVVALAVGAFSIAFVAWPADVSYAGTMATYLPGMLRGWAFSFIHGENAGMPVIVQGKSVIIHWYGDSFARALLLNTALTFVVLALALAVLQASFRRFRSGVKS